MSAWWMTYVALWAGNSCFVRVGWDSPCAVAVPLGAMICTNGNEERGVVVAKLGGCGFRLKYGIGGTIFIAGRACRYVGGFFGGEAEPHAIVTLRCFACFDR